MINEEKAYCLIQEHLGEKIEYFQRKSVEKALLEMAAWKDEQPKENNCGKILQLRRRAYKKGYDKAIEKACEWLKENISHYVTIGHTDWYKTELLIEKEELTAELKKAMEE